MNIDTKNCAYRVDGHASEESYPYRARINGEFARNAQGEPRTFRTLAEACAYVVENRA